MHTIITVVVMQATLKESLFSSFRRTFLSVVGLGMTSQANLYLFWKLKECFFQNFIVGPSIKIIVCDMSIFNLEIERTGN